ncbi:hypothetical protein PIB30_097094 [Stylosanthes scabra]|uniref:Putative plant transposon protein domain-containing protein n=1 Tax=Stylosanthes scabra TaxID=79078 RepID=A0ABU6WUH6_9FABA|nr:hypothetical protein [Stylosanthes scabra]
MADRKKKGKAVATSSNQASPRFKTLYHESHFNSMFSARRILPELILQADEDVFNPIRYQIYNRKYEKFTKPIQAVSHLMVKEFYANAWEPDKAKRKHPTYTSSVRGTEYEFVCRSILPTTNRSELTVERAMLIHSIIIDENINVEEIIAEQIYKFVYKTDISSSLPFPSIIASLCADAKIRAIPNDTLIPQEPPIVAEAMVRTREPRARARQATPPQQHPQQPPQFQQQQDFSSSFYTHFDTSMSQIQRRLNQQHEENRRSFEAINTRMDRMDDQLSFWCYSNQMANEQMLSPYQNTARKFKEMEMQGIPVTMANLAIHRQREEANKGKAREIVPDSEDSEDTFVSGESEEF